MFYGFTSPVNNHSTEWLVDGPYPSRAGHADGTSMATTTPPTLSVTEAAVRLGVSVRTVHRRVASGDIPTTKDGQGRTRIPVEAVRPAERSPEALAVSDTMSRVLDRYAATMTRMERSRTRWGVAAVAGVAVGVTGATLAAVVSLSAGKAGDTLSDTNERLHVSTMALVEAEREIGALRLQVSDSDRLADTWQRQARDTSDRVSQLSAELALMTAERDRLACQDDEAQALAYLATALD